MTMQVQPNIGDHVRVHPSGETGRITQVMDATDGSLTYQVEFDDASTANSRGGSGETGGIYSLDHIELIR
jgi:hypothetical protein